MDVEEFISELNAKHYEQIRKSLQVVVCPDTTMNPNLTANLRADRELKLKIIREKLVAAQPHLVEAINLIHHNNLAPFFGEIYSDIADAHFYCGEAISKIDEHPQPDQ